MHALKKVRIERVLTFPIKDIVLFLRHADADKQNLGDREQQLPERSVHTVHRRIDRFNPTEDHRMSFSKFK
jgi:hypothetical protein